MTPGILIAIEGVDGAGKTTQVERLTDHLRATGRDVVRSKEPTDGQWGRLIRHSAATGRMSLDDELNAFMADREEHVRTLVRPALEQGKIVILDRYFYSTIAYQGARGKDPEALTELMLAKAPEPDVVFLLDVPADIGVARVRRRGDRPNQFEGVANLQTARSLFLDIAQKRSNVIVIDATQSEDAVHHAIMSALENLVCNRGK